MKNLIFTLLLILAVSSINYGQAVLADPAVNQMRTAAVTSPITISADEIPLTDIVTLRVPVINYNITNSLPSGTCKIKIGLGSKLELDPNFDLTTINTSNYFSWTAIFSGGQIQITGDLIAPLPANFLDTVTFNIKGKIIGSSTITTNFLVTNHNTTTILSDENGNNNTTFLPYTIVPGGILPVNFTKVTAVKAGCNISVNFDTENEINVDRYEIEICKDGINFEKKGQLAAGNLTRYSLAFILTENIKAPQIFIRIKSIDKDEKFQYSETRKISGTCDDKDGIGSVILFPNPAAYETSEVFIRANETLFNGNYTVSLLDITGKLLHKKRMNLISVKQFVYETPALAAGQYIFSIANSNGSPNIVLKWQKN